MVDQSKSDDESGESSTGPGDHYGDDVSDVGFLMLHESTDDDGAVDLWEIVVFGEDEEVDTTIVVVDYRRRRRSCKGFDQTSDLGVRAWLGEEHGD